MIDVPKIGCNISKHIYINLFITSCVCAWYLLVSIIHLALSANCVQLVYTELSAVIVYQVWRYGIWAKWPKFFLCKTSITFLFLCISRLKGRVISHKIYTDLTFMQINYVFEKKDSHRSNGLVSMKEKTQHFLILL